VFLLALFAIVLGYVRRFLDDFVIPIMYRDRCGILQAWQTFFDLARAHAGHLVLYGLFYFLLCLLAGAAILAAILLTCCLAGCLLAIPYIGTVALLPVLVFFRLYGLEYLAQYGRKLDLLRAETDAPAA
jgi:hypothetical protein